MITNKIKKVSLKATHQREKILEYILKEKEHPTADMIYTHILKELTHVSRTTVYNNVKQLTNAGLIKSIQFTGSNEIRYDGIVDSHHHFICEKCGKIYDIAITCCHFDKKEIEGHKVKNVYAYFTGICSNCK